MIQVWSLCMDTSRNMEVTVLQVPTHRHSSAGSVSKDSSSEAWGQHKSGLPWKYRLMQDGIQVQRSSCRTHLHKQSTGNSLGSLDPRVLFPFIYLPLTCWMVLVKLPSFYMELVQAKLSRMLWHNGQEDRAWSQPSCYPIDVKQVP